MILHWWVPARAKVPQRPQGESTHHPRIRKLRKDDRFTFQNDRDHEENW